MRVCVSVDMYICVCSGKAYLRFAEEPPAETEVLKKVAGWTPSAEQCQDCFYCRRAMEDSPYSTSAAESWASPPCQRICTHPLYYLDCEHAIRKAPFMVGNLSMVIKLARNSPKYDSLMEKVVTPLLPSTTWDIGWGEWPNRVYVGACVGGWVYECMSVGVGVNIYILI